MPEVKPKLLNKKIDGLNYFIAERGEGGTIRTKRVEAVEIAYDRIGLRFNGKTIILDHIPTGWKIGTFRTEAKARAAIRELMQVTDFKWIRPPKEVHEAVNEILKRYQS